MRDVQISIVTDAEVDVIVDHVPGFNDDPTTINAVYRAANGTTSGFIDPRRYIRVSAANGASKPLGKYVLGIRAIN